MGDVRPAGRNERFGARMTTRPSIKDPGWVSLTEARTILGVSASTVRRWGDSGVVRTFVTPGGHRRFSRAGLEALLPARPTGRPSLGDLGATPGRMARGYRAASADGHGTIPWVAELDGPSRERFRGYGRNIVASLVAALDTDDTALRAERLGLADGACTEYGRVAGREGLGAPTTADLFLRFRRPFLAELGALARRREFDANAIATLMDEANAALDGLLLATLRGWESAVLEAADHGAAALAATDPAATGLAATDPAAHEATGLATRARETR
jgi:hypothetical protein